MTAKIFHITALQHQLKQNQRGGITAICGLGVVLAGFKVLAFCLDIPIHFGGGATLFSLIISIEEGKATRATGLLTEQGGRR
ncbi:hypothetical protein DM860_004218 [Cuscuta australis]|uniref:Uncharacterized protein n=1 Tax=Cuscuta australis TaxID=267555 RepID=A0A328CW89_9ASTE|nr:hypothetical protein DM860_004218 [Cuscuta australis]